MKKILIVLVVLALGYFVFTQFDFGGNDISFEDSGGGGNTGTTLVIYSPSEVVTMFMRATLGTIPGSLIDYDLAKTLIDSGMAANWSGAGDAYIPLTYGIQQGPDKVEISDERVDGSTATVEVWGYWGDEMQKKWYFELENTGSEWLISSLTPADQDLYY
jgi:hypothetical protein